MEPTPVETTHYDARRISVELCGYLGLEVIVDPQATDVAVSHPVDAYVVAECSNGILSIQGSGAQLDISGGSTVLQDIKANGGTVVAPMRGDIHIQSINIGGNGVVMAPMRGGTFINGQPVPASEVSGIETRRYSSGLYEVKTTQGDERKIVLAYNLEREPQLTLRVPPEGDNGVLIEVDGRYGSECLWIY